MPAPLPGSGGTTGGFIGKARPPAPIPNIYQNLQGGGGFFGGIGKSMPHIQPPQKKRKFNLIDLETQHRNPYESVEGFEDYVHPKLRFMRGDVGGKEPSYEGFPEVARVQQISDAMKRFGGFQYGGARNPGRGASVDDYGDMLRRLLRERLGMGDV